MIPIMHCHNAIMREYPLAWLMECLSHHETNSQDYTYILLVFKQLLVHSIGYCDDIGTGLSNAMDILMSNPVSLISVILWQYFWEIVIISSKQICNENLTTYQLVEWYQNMMHYLAHPPNELFYLVLESMKLHPYIPVVEVLHIAQDLERHGYSYDGYVVNMIIDKIVKEDKLGKQVMLQTLIEDILYKIMIDETKSVDIALVKAIFSNYIGLRYFEYWGLYLACIKDNAYDIAIILDDYDMIPDDVRDIGIIIQDLPENIDGLFSVDIVSDTKLLGELVGINEHKLDTFVDVIKEQPLYYGIETFYLSTNQNIAATDIPKQIKYNLDQIIQSPYFIDDRYTEAVFRSLTHFFNPKILMHLNYQSVLMLFDVVYQRTNDKDKLTMIFNCFLNEILKYQKSTAVVSLYVHFETFQIPFNVQTIEIWFKYFNKYRSVFFKETYKLLDILLTNNLKINKKIYSYIIFYLIKQNRMTKHEWYKKSFELYSNK